MDIRLLPGVALTAVGQRLEEPDAASCRLASRQLATVAPQQQQQTGSCLQVSASSFQAQLRAEKQQEPATRRDKEGVPTADAAAATGARAERAARRQALAAPAAEHHHEGDGTQQASTANQQQQQHQSNGAVLPRFSKTAGSVVRAAALLGCSCVRLHVDVLQAYADVTWQQLFSALAACPGITSVRVIEYASLQDRKDFEFWQPATPAMQELTQRVLDTGSGCLDTTTAAGRRYKHCNWLLELAARLSKQLQELDLQLQAPLPPAQQRLLLQLQALRTLKHGPADDMLMPDEILVVLLPQVVVQLSALQQLRSLTIVMGPAEDKEQDIQVALKLQQTFGTLGSRLTHLSFGLADAKTKLQLSAPLNRMPELQTLICRSGFTLDAEDLLYPELDPAGSDQGFDSSSDSAAAAAAAAAQVVPSLTRLVLNSGWDHGPLLQLLTQPSREGLAAAASRTLLQQLELNCHRELPFELMNQLEGLRSLKFMAQEKHDLADFIARAPALVKQLQGLTAMLTQPSSQYDEWAAPYRPVSLLTALTGLTSLKVIGTPYVLLSTSQDLPLLASTMPQLQGLTFVGGLTQQRTAALPMQVGSHRSSSISSFIVLETPPRLTGLALFCMEPDSKERQTLRFMHGALPSSLKSLCITGVTSSMQGPDGDTAGSAAGWQDVRDSSSSGRHQAEGAGEGAAAADNAAGSGGSSKAGRPAAAPSAGGDVLAGLPLLENADVTMESLEDAAVMLRSGSNLLQLTLTLRPPSIVTSLQDIRVADTTAAAADAAAATAAQSAGVLSCAAAGVPWPQQLTSLHLGVPGEGRHWETTSVTPGLGTMQSNAAADARGGLPLLLSSLHSLRQLKQLSLSCSKGMRPDAQRSLSCLSSLTRLQTLQLNFACCRTTSMHSDQASASAAAARAELGTMDTAEWAQVVEGLQRCSRLREVVLGPTLPCDYEQQMHLQDQLPNCCVYNAW